MTPANSTSSTEISDIQRRMAQIRHEMHQDVKEAVKGAQSLTDWRSLVRSHPWLVLGAAAATGYLIVPKRGRDTRSVASESRAPARAAQSAPQHQPADASRANWSTLGTVFSLLAPVVVRAAQNYALKQFGEWLERHPLHPAAIEQRRRNESDTAPGEHAAKLAGFRDSR